MAEEYNTMPISLLDELHTPGAGYDMIRYIGLPDMFGAEADTMLYVMGKNLARRFEIQSISDIAYAFEKLGWGQLELVKERKHELIFQLMADSVVNTLTAPFETEFRLEAGFLAQSVEQAEHQACECSEDIHKTIHIVEFTIFYTE